MREREPAPLSELIGRLAGERGWEDRVAAGRLRTRWAEVVGDHVASHSEPVALADGVLLVRADGGAWATELALLAPRVAAQADAFLGGGVVREARVVGGGSPGRRRPGGGGGRRGSQEGRTGRGKPSPRAPLPEAKNGL